MVNVSNSPLLEGHTFPDKETLLMMVAEEANLYGEWIKIVLSDGLQVDVRGADGDPFHVLGNYGLIALRWEVTECIARNAGRMAYDPGETGRTKGKGESRGNDAIPPLAVADLAPPPPNETVGDAFDDLSGILEESCNPDKAEEEGNPDKAGMSIGQDIVIKSKKARRIKSPIKTKLDCASSFFSHFRNCLPT